MSLLLYLPALIPMLLCILIKPKAAMMWSFAPNIAYMSPLTPALQRDDKGVQVDLQDLGYETSGKSENDREESSSTGRRCCMSVSLSWTLIPGCG